jgi:hypothetical protein
MSVKMDTLRRPFVYIVRVFTVEVEIGEEFELIKHWINYCDKEHGDCSARAVS